MAIQAIPGQTIHCKGRTIHIIIVGPGGGGGGDRSCRHKESGGTAFEGDQLLHDRPSFVKYTSK